MKGNITALDLHHLLEDLEVLYNSRVDKIYQPQKKELLFQLYSRDFGKKILRINVPKYIFMTEFKQDQPLKPSGFCQFLRKRLDRSILLKINQFEFERVIELVFQAKEEKYRLICELFSTGNVVLCKDDYEIVFPLESQEWSQRIVKAGEIYDYPHKEFNFKNLTFEKLEETINDSDRDLVRTLAIDLGLGGTYAEELCSRAGIEKNKNELSNEEIRTLFTKSRELLEEDKPTVYYEEEKVFAISPIKLSKLEMKEEDYDTLNNAFNVLLTKRFLKKQKKERLSDHQDKIDKLKKVIEEQKKQLLDLKNSIDENTRKGEVIYENYSKINGLLQRINEMEKKTEWEEIKKELSKDPAVKSVNLKQKEINIKI